MLDNASKETWYPVHAPDSGGPTDNLIVADNPVDGDVIGHYSDMGVAHYISTLHNNHVSGHPVLREVDLMYQSEIHFGIVGFWDAGVEWYLGVSLDDAVTRGNQPTIEEALADMVNMARRSYPESDFAKLFGGDVEVDPDQRSVETLSQELADRIGKFDLAYDPTGPHDEPNWTVVPGHDRTVVPEHGDGWAGYTARDALLLALESRESHPTYR